MSAEEIVREVFARVRAGDLRVADLYAPDATLTSPDETHEGRAAILEFYRSRFREGGVMPQVDALYVNLPIVVAVLRVNTPSGVVHQVADVFELTGDSISAMPRLYAYLSRANELQKAVTEDRLRDS